MLRLRSCIAAASLSSPSASHVSPLHRLLSAAANATAPRISPNPSFAVEDYLVRTCGLTRAQALKASTKLSHLKSPSKPDAVLAFLAGLGLSTADVAAVVSKDPKLLCAGVEETLAPVVDGLTGLGLSHSEIARLVSLARQKFRQKSSISKLQYYLHLFRSSENLLRAMKFCDLLSHSLKRVVKPNVAFLRECGLGDYDIAKLCVSRPRMITTRPEHIQAMVACAENIGVPRYSGMFRHALHAVASFNEEEVSTRVDYLKSTFMWTDAEVGIAVSKAPNLLMKSKVMMQRRSEFFISEVGLEPAYIAHRPIMLTYSLEGRVRPRYYAVKFLTENGLLDYACDFYNTVMVSEKVFMKKFICPHKQAAPNLAEDYATACRGEVPARFSFT
ncbi:uncharacterized protein LOC123413496 [Hordeum vulgare subsp. vulgare]|uniref:Predicted protein n=1 Tax=Hordeum vulgare subsp. vulgare TaxID=112509 RepID=F2CXP2_HORVV|nr:uncharacterized protein LOC123413496 [Hordeum vulgare subsp. vulgare]BAJ87613.1 predicted protein [Hordeum vulgare subsp. vulgare]